MDAHWSQVLEVLEAVLELPAEERERYLDTACPEPQIRRYVESLIESFQNASGDLDEPAAEAFLREAKAGPMYMERQSETATPEAGDGAGNSGAPATAASRVTPPNNSSDAAGASSVRATEPGATAGGPRVGAYQLKAKLGEGGMGAVFRAARADKKNEREVAVKLVKGEFFSEFAVKWFSVELQGLAKLDHPNIARLLDGGITEDGTPYFVTEMVRGMPIDVYCDAEKLSINERLRLFRTVCGAVTYAHQNLVAHRALKPPNILVTDDGVPKLLDFGIAKMLNPEAFSSEVEETMSIVRMLMPQYASPEQAKGETITTASDVYSLGVLLSVLLAGRMPYSFVTTNSESIAKAICETPPVKPSAIVRRPVESAGSKPHDDERGRAEPTAEQIGSNRGEQVDQLARKLEGDLDTIVLLALRKEPTRRYASVEQFSEDIRSFLEGRPVVARGDSARYRAWKFFQRHAVAVTVSGLMALSLTGGLGLSLRQAHVARVERARAERRFNDVKELANSLFDLHDSIKDLPGAVPARQLLVTEALKYLDNLLPEAAGDVPLQDEVANAYERVGDLQGNPNFANLGDTAGALTSYRKALAIREALVAQQPNNEAFQWSLSGTYLELGWCLESANDRKGAIENLRKALAITELIASSSNDPIKLDQLAGNYYGVAALMGKSGEFGAAMDGYQKAAAIRQSIHHATPSEDATLRMHLAGDYSGMAEVLDMQGDKTGALEIQNRAVALLKGLTASDRKNATARRLLAVGQEYQGIYQEKAGFLDEALVDLGDAQRILEPLANANPSDTLTKTALAFTEMHLGSVATKKGDPSRGLNELESAHQKFEVLMANTPPKDFLRRGMAECEFEIGLAERAEAQARRRGAKPLWESAVAHFAKAQQAWADIQSRGELAPADENTIKELQKQLAQSNDALSRAR